MPIAITAIQGANLTAAAVTSTVQLNAVVPGLNIRTTSGSFLPFIRGVGTSSNTVESPVALYVDGVYLPQGREGLRDLNDIEQVAVLKGPQGTLFGRNATGGVIQITTRAPSRTSYGEIGSEIDNYLTWKTDAYLTGPLSDTLAFSLSGLYAKQFEGYGKNFTTGNDTYQLEHNASLRGKLLWQPTDRTAVTLIADYSDRLDHSGSYQSLRGTTPFGPILGPYKTRYDTYAGTDSPLGSRGGGVSVKIEQDIGFGKLSSISAYRRSEGSFDLVPTADAALSLHGFTGAAPSESYSEELQLASQPGRFNWVTGVFYFHNYTAFLPLYAQFAGFLVTGPGSLVQAARSGQERSESVAPFAQFNWEFIPDTTLTGGVRWTYEKRSAVLSQMITFRNGVSVSPPGISDSITAREPTFRVALSHQFGPDVLTYASFNTGFKSGGYNISTPANPSYLPEKLKSWEVGFKSQLFDNRVRLNAAAYYYDYTNLQVTRFSNAMQFIQNGASAKLYGIDLDVVAKLTSELRLTGGLAIEHTEFSDYPNAVIAVPQPNGSNVLISGSAKGNRVPLAQKAQGNIALDYHHDLASGTVDANLTAAVNGNYYFEADNGRLKQGGYVTLNGTVRYTFPGDKVTVSVFGKNLLDEAVLIFPNTQTWGYFANYAPPRTFGGAVRVKF